MISRRIRDLIRSPSRPSCLALDFRLLDLVICSGGIEVREVPAQHLRGKRNSKRSAWGVRHQHSLGKQLTCYVAGDSLMQASNAGELAAIEFARGQRLFQEFGGFRAQFAARSPALLACMRESPAT